MNVRAVRLGSLLFALGCSGQVTEPADSGRSPGMDATSSDGGGAWSDASTPPPDAGNLASADAAVPGADAAAPGPDAAAAGPDAATDLVIQRLGDTFEIPSIAGGKRHAGVAYDPTHDVYLVVHGQGDGVVGGAFVSGAGAPVGAPFAVCTTTSWTQSPSVAWFPAAGSFLVAWHDGRIDLSSKTRLWARHVAYAAGAPSMAGPEFQVSVEPSYQETLPAIGCAGALGECLIAWESATGAALLARRVDANGPVGGEIEVAPAGDWNADPSVESAPGGPTWLVTNSFAGGAGAEVHARRVQQGTGAIVGTRQVLGTAAGTWITRAQWDPVHSRYLVGWWQGSLRGRFVAADGTASGADFALVPGYGYNDGFALSYSAPAGLYAAAMHGGTAEDFAALIGPDGASGPAIAATASPANTNGNFNPRLAAHGTRKEWLLVTVRNFAAIIGQRLRAP